MMFLTVLQWEIMGDIMFHYLEFSMKAVDELDDLLVNGSIWVTAPFFGTYIKSLNKLDDN